MKRNLFIALTTLVLASLACNMLVNAPFSNIKTGPTETFSIDEPFTVGSTTTDVRLSMAPSSAALTLAGGGQGMVEGEIRYNVAEWKPTLSASDGTLRISQDLPDDEVHTISGEAINDWNLKLGDGFVNVTVECPAGDFTLDFTDTLPDGVTIDIEMGAGNLRVIVPDGIAASIDVTRGPSDVTTEGAWTQNGSNYLSGGSGSAWTIHVTMGVGGLALVSR
jgi:hypothetical protein